MISVSGFNAFNQVCFMSNVLHQDVKSESLMRNKNSLKEFHTVPVKDGSALNITASWSYFLPYTGNTMWICGIIDRKACSVQNIKAPDGYVIRQVGCNRRQIVCVMEGGSCWQYSVNGSTTGGWKDLTLLLESEAPLDADENSPSGVKVTKVCCGETVTAVLTEKGEVFNMPNRLSMPQVKIVDIACGRSHIIMLSDKGEVYAVGEGSRGQLGSGELDNEESPRLVEGLAGLTVVAIGCGGWHSCALTAEGDLYTWGWNSAGQLGHCGTEPSQEIDVPVQAVPLVVDWPNSEQVTIVKVACGARHTVTLLNDGSVWGCGWNKYGQLALPLPSEQIVKQMTRLPTPPVQTTDIICGPWNTFLIS